MVLGLALMACVGVYICLQIQNTLIVTDRKEKQGNSSKQQLYKPTSALCFKEMFIFQAPLLIQVRTAPTTARLHPTGNTHPSFCESKSREMRSSNFTWISRESDWLHQNGSSVQEPTQRFWGDVRMQLHSNKFSFSRIYCNHITTLIFTTPAWLKFKESEQLFFCATAQLLPQEHNISVDTLLHQRRRVGWGFCGSVIVRSLFFKKDLGAHFALNLGFSMSLQWPLTSRIKSNHPCLKLDIWLIWEKKSLNQFLR